MSLKEENPSLLNFLKIIDNTANFILAENIRERVNIPVKLSVVGSTKSGIWRRERIRMTDQEMDDVAFLTGGGINFNLLHLILFVLKTYSIDFN